MKILFIGLGGIGQRHLRNVYTKYNQNANILAYRVRNFKQTISPNLMIDQNIDLIKKYSVDVFMDLDKALAQSPDVAFVCNPTSYHITSCLAVAEAGCDLFVEKPLSHSIDGTEKLLSLSKSKRVIGMVGYQFRFHPCYKLFKKLIEEGKIGNPLSGHIEIGEYLPNWHKYEDYRQMYASRKDLGGGVILSQIHEIDYLYDLFGMPTKVIALGGHLSGLEIDVEDVVDVLLEMKIGENPLPISLHMDYVQQPASRGCKIIGESGKITMDLTNLKVILEIPNKKIMIYDFNGLDRNKLFIDEVDHFFDCCVSRRQPIATLNDGLNGLKISLAIKESLETGKIIYLRA